MGAKYTDAQKKASMKYLKENTDDIRIRVPKGKKDEYKQQALTHKGMSLNSYIQFLLEEAAKDINGTSEQEEKE